MKKKTLTICDHKAPSEIKARCVLPNGHKGKLHTNGNGISWDGKPTARSINHNGHVAIDELLNLEINEPEGTEVEAQGAVRVLLKYMGEDPNREGLLDTPKRVVKAWDEMTCGYGQDPADILARDFDAHNYDEAIVVPNVEFFSTCEHHLLPFWGVAHVAYIPGKKNPRVVGLSKLARLVDCFARRLQIQEKMTTQIADAIQVNLKPAGIAVVIEAKHMCMCARGVQKHRSQMTTSIVRGAFRSNASARAEFFQLIELAKKS